MLIYLLSHLFIKIFGSFNPPYFLRVQSCIHLPKRHPFVPAGHILFLTFAIMHQEDLKVGSWKIQLENLNGSDSNSAKRNRTVKKLGQVQSAKILRLTRATPRIWGKVYEEHPEGVRWRAAHEVWNQALSLAHTTSHRGRMEAPKPKAGPFIATTMGFLKRMNANTKSLKGVTEQSLPTLSSLTTSESVFIGVRFLITARHLQSGCFLFVGQWTDALSGTMAPGHCRKQSPRSWAIIICCHQQLHYPELDTLPSWSGEGKGRRVYNFLYSSDTWRKVET